MVFAIGIGLLPLLRLLGRLARVLAGLLQVLRLLDRFLDRADHVERLLGERVAFAVDDHLETFDRLLERHELAGGTGEHLGDVERLRQEPLDLPGARHREFVLGREFVHAEDRDDVAQLLVALQDRLHRARRVVVLLADRVRSIWREVESSGSTAGYIPSEAISRESTTVASRWANVVAGDGSVRSSAGT